MEIRTSVRNLVEFLLRNGDISNKGKGSSKDAMLEGGRIHRMIQRRMGPDYHAEVSLRFCVPMEDYTVTVEGRADGIIIKDEGVTIDEIKGTYGDLEKKKEPEILHLAQAKCYAFIYADQNDLRSIKVQITYCHMETELIKRFTEEYTYDELKDWFEGLMREYKKWADLDHDWKIKRKDSIRNTEFPFEYRDGQKDLVTYVYRTIYHGRKLFIEAPTGVGKTMATIFPSVKAMGEDMVEKIFYLTAKTITGQVAGHALSILREQGLLLRSVVLTAKDKICFMDEADCDPEICQYAKGHFDRVNDALYELLTTSDNLNRERIMEIAIKYQVCPFELSLDASLFADMIVCDYNYLFDPHAYLRRFFSEGIREDYAFLIDEAHNLVERGRDMYSAEVIKEDFLKMKALCKEHSNKITRATESCNKELLALKRECTEYEVLSVEKISPFVRRLLHLYTVIEEYLDEHEDTPIRKELLLFYFDISHFLLINDLLSDKYVIYSDFTESGDFRLKLFNVDPSDNIGRALERGRSGILFSATLLPIDYYKDLLGASKDDYEVYAKSVFDNDKRGLFIVNDVTSRYTRRGYDEYKKIAQYINEISHIRPGNYMAFFPSYRFMQDVSDIYIDLFGDDELLIQDQSMNEQKREEFLGCFEEGRDETLIGMCVLGGIFSEGIDLKNESLIGAIIVGTGIPMVCNERQILKNYFDDEDHSGYDYSYKFPGMNKVLQASGRVIRTMDDVGVVVLLDERFTETGYKRLFPREWGNYKVISGREISSEIERFWQDHPLG